jgi:hypothetical protein
MDPGAFGRGVETAEGGFEAGFQLLDGASLVVRGIVGDDPLEPDTLAGELIRAQPCDGLPCGEVMAGVCARERSSAATATAVAGRSCCASLSQT